MSLEGNILAFDPLDDPPGVEIIDRVERLRYQLHTPEPISPTAVDSDEFLFPVDSAISITTEEIVLPTVVGVCIWDESGEMVTEVGHLDDGSVGEGKYTLELSAQIKTYIEVEGPIEITSDLVEVRIGFGSQRPLELGAVSWHDRPAATVTTTDEPADMMAAISTFGSALKATSPERSFPSNRGHPPAVELGDTLKVPPSIQRPESGIRLEIPPEYGDVYAAAPLAYYLGADVTPGSDPRLVTETGYEHPLDAPDGLEQGIERTLKQIFLLDCVTRTEGVYEIPLRERNELEQFLTLDWNDLYDSSMAEQVATYLEIPYTLLEPYIPEWRLTVHVDPVSSTVKQLPFVVDDLAVVHTADPSQRSGLASRAGEAQALTRDGILTRSAAGASNTDEATYVEPQSSTSLEQAWIGDSIPIGASKLTPEAFQNRLELEATDGDISITIVLNDSRMSEERDLVDSAYGNRETLPFDVRVCRNLTVEELRDQLYRERNFLHYIGHTEQDGFECADGKLDAATLNQTGIDAFLLNACNSYRQGLHLIEGGAIGGIVTLNDVINDGAVKIGETIARLLNAGFPLRAALTIARDESILGGQYIVVGDGGMTVTQAASRTPNILEINSGTDGYTLHIKTYATDDAGLGSVYKPHLSKNNEYFLNSGDIPSFDVSEAELVRFLQMEEVPVKNDGKLRWSSSLDIGDIE